MKKTILRTISVIMLIVAIVFLVFALSHPEAGTVFHIGNLTIGSTVWKIFYIVYTVVMIVLFTVSFFVGKTKVEEAE